MPRSSPTPRAEGRQRFVDATIALLREVPIDDLTVRQIAERAGHHHRFVSEWFGSKSLLFREAMVRLLTDAAATGTFPFGDGRVHPDVRLAIRVGNWLNLNDPAALQGALPNVYRDGLVALYREQMGLDPELAEMMATRLIIMVIGFELYGPVFGIDLEAQARHRQLELRLASLLSERS
jgi:AcrR family transcriptional regulator